MHKMLLNRKKTFLLTSYKRVVQYFYRCGSESSDSDKTKTSVSKCEGSRELCDVCRSYPCECNPSTPTMYERRKFSHNLPSDGAIPHFEILPNLPTGIFRCTAGEVLGRGANKCSYYQNPEYFSYHHMTFYDIHMLLRCYRNPSAKTGRKN